MIVAGSLCSGSRFCSLFILSVTVEMPSSLSGVLFLFWFSFALLSLLSESPPFLGGGTQSVGDAFDDRTLQEMTADRWHVLCATNHEMYGREGNVFSSLRFYAYHSAHERETMLRLRAVAAHSLLQLLKFLVSGAHMNTANRFSTHLTQESS